MSAARITLPGPYPSSLHFTRQLQFHALKGTVAVLFKAEHSVKMTIVINGGSMVDHIIEHARLDYWKICFPVC